MGGINMQKLITDIQLLNSDGEMMTRDVRLANGKIAEIGEQLEVGTSEVIEGKGLFLSPGFINNIQIKILSYDIQFF